jgi:hypothetical protein
MLSLACGLWLEPSSLYCSLPRLGVFDGVPFDPGAFNSAVFDASVFDKRKGFLGRRSDGDERGLCRFFKLGPALGGVAEWKLFVGCLKIRVDEKVS